MTDSCLFCGIVSGAVPAIPVYQDEMTIAFLDPYPKSRGHVLLIPRAHSTGLLDAAPDTLTVLLPAIQRVSRAMCQALNVEGFNLVQNNGAVAGQAIPHLHFHLIPRRADDGLLDWPSTESSADDRQMLAARISEALSI
jgi:histidine triad (HIT) family protein